MKKILLCAAFIAASFTSIAQVGVGTITPDGSAALDVTSTTKGFLMPRMTNAQRLAIASPAAGLQVFVTDFDGGRFMHYDGTGWGTFSFIKSPDAPTIGTAVAGESLATVSYTAPASDGGSVITSYTATSSPGDFTGSLSQAGSGTITVTGLANGTGYTFTVTATNAIGTSAASTASNSVTPAALPTSQVASNGSGGTYTFLAHNLGADLSLDEHTPVVGLQGAYVHWGKRGPTNFLGAANDGPSGFAAAPTALAAYDGVISGWSLTGAAGGSWNVDENNPVKVTANDPCPTGYRVPTRNEWTAVNTNNTVSRTGAFTAGTTQYGSALHYGPDASTKLLTLPAAGFRNFSNGALGNRGFSGHYWSSTEDGGTAYYLDFDSGFVIPARSNNRMFGFSVRCIAE